MQCTPALLAASAVAIAQATQPLPNNDALLSQLWLLPWTWAVTRNSFRTRRGLFPSAEEFFERHPYRREELSAELDESVINWRALEFPLSAIADFPGEAQRLLLLAGLLVNLSGVPEMYPVVLQQISTVVTWRGASL